MIWNKLVRPILYRIHAVRIYLASCFITSLIVRRGEKASRWTSGHWIYPFWISVWTKINVFLSNWYYFSILLLCLFYFESEIAFSYIQYQYVKTPHFYYFILSVNRKPFWSHIKIGYCRVYVHGTKRTKNTFWKLLSLILLHALKSLCDVWEGTSLHLCNRGLQTWWM